MELRAFVAERSTPENRAKIKAILGKYGVRKLTELNSHELYGRIFCAVCGEPYVQRTFTKRAAGGKSRYYKVWCCRSRMKGSGCKNPNVREEYLLSAVKNDGMYLVTPEGGIVEST